MWAVSANYMHYCIAMKINYAEYTNDCATLPCADHCLYRHPFVVRDDMLRELDVQCIQEHGLVRIERQSPNVDGFKNEDSVPADDTTTAASLEQNGQTTTTTAHVTSTNSAVAVHEISTSASRPMPTGVDIYDMVPTQAHPQVCITMCQSHSLLYTTFYSTGFLFG